MRLLRAFPAVLFLTATLIGCGGDDSNAPSASHVGTYTLSTVGGSPLPVTIAAGSDQVVIQSGRITLNANNSFTEETTVQATIGGFIPVVQTVECSGSYQLSGTSITLTGLSGDYCEGGSETGTLSGNTLTVTLEGFSAVFTR